MRALVTGGAGFIGSTIVRRFAADDARVVRERFRATLTRVAACGGSVG